MHFSVALLAFAALFFSGLSMGQSPSCLVAEEVPGIATRWLNVFTTDGSGMGTGTCRIPNVVTANVSIYDQAYSKGDPAPYITSSRQLLSLASTGYGRLFSGPIITNISYETQFVFSSCDRIGVRWRSIGFASGKLGTAAVGTPTSYSGTDTLHVDLASRLIYNATLSSDRLVLYRQLGITTIPT